MGLTTGFRISSVKLIRKEHFLTSTSVAGHDLDLTERYSAAVSPISITHELNQPSMLDIGLVYLPNEKDALKPEDIPDIEDIIHVEGTITKTVGGRATDITTNLFVGFVTEKPKWNFIGAEEITVINNVEQPKKGGWTYTIKCTGLEWLLNVKGIPQRLTPYINKSHRFILVDLLSKIINPIQGVSFIYDEKGGYTDGVYTGSYTDDVNVGNFESFYKPDPRKKWSEIANDFATKDNYRYWISDFGKFNYEPLSTLLTSDALYGDMPEKNTNDYLYLTDDRVAANFLGYTPNDINFSELSISTSEYDHKNDVTVIGDNAPAFLVNEEHLATGVGSYRLREKPYGLESSVLLENEWSNSLDTSKWYIKTATTQTFDFFEIFEGTLNVKKDDNLQHATYSNYIRSNQSVEMAGSLVVRAGELRNFDCTETSGGAAYVGCLCNSAEVPASGITSTCEAGWFVLFTTLQNTAYVQIAPIRRDPITGLGQVITPFTSIQVSAENDPENVTKSIIPLIHINVDEPQRIVETGAFTSTTNINSNATLRFEVLVYSLEEYTKPNRIDCGTFVGIPLSPTLVFLPVVNYRKASFGMSYTSITRPIQVNATLLEPTSTTPRQLLLGQSLNGCDATVQSDSNISSLVFYDTLGDGITSGVPKQGSRISLSYWAERQASARVQSENDIIHHTVSKTTTLPDGTIVNEVFDDGLRSAVITDLSPKPRNDKEAELAARAYLDDHLQPQWEGSYSSHFGFILDEPMNPGAKVILDFAHYKDFVKELATNTQMESRRIVARLNEFSMTETGEGSIKYSLKFKPRDTLKTYLNKILLNRTNVILNTDAIETEPDEVNVITPFIPELPPIRIYSIDKNTVYLKIPPIPIVSVSANTGQLSGHTLLIHTLDRNWALGSTSDRLATVTLSTSTETNIELSRSAIGRNTALYLKLKVTYTPTQGASQTLFSQRASLLYVNYPKTPAPINTPYIRTDIGENISISTPIPTGSRTITPIASVGFPLFETYYAQDMAGLEIFDKHHNSIYKGIGSSDASDTLQSPALGTLALHDYLLRYDIVNGDTFNESTKTITLTALTSQMKVNQYANYILSNNIYSDVIASNTATTITLKTWPTSVPSVGDTIYIHVSSSYTSEIDGYRHKFVIPNKIMSRSLDNFYIRTYSLLNEYDVTQEVYSFNLAYGVIRPKYPTELTSNSVFSLTTGDWVVLKNDTGTAIENSVWQIEISAQNSVQMISLKKSEDGADYSYTVSNNVPSGNYPKNIVTATTTRTGTRLFKLLKFTNDPPEITTAPKYDNVKGRIVWKGKNADGWKVSVYDRKLQATDKVYDVPHGSTTESDDVEISFPIPENTYKSVKHVFAIMGYDDFGVGEADPNITFATAQAYCINTGDTAAPALVTPTESNYENSNIQLSYTSGTKTFRIKRKTDIKSRDFSGINAYPTTGSLDGLHVVDKKLNISSTDIELYVRGKNTIPEDKTAQDVAMQFMALFNKEDAETAGYPTQPYSVGWWGYVDSIAPASGNVPKHFIAKHSTDYATQAGYKLPYMNVGEKDSGFIVSPNLHSLKQIKYAIVDSERNTPLYSITPEKTSTGSPLNKFHISFSDLSFNSNYDTCKLYFTGGSVVYDTNDSSSVYWNDPPSTAILDLPKKISIHSKIFNKTYIFTPYVGGKTNGVQYAVVAFPHDSHTEFILSYAYNSVDDLTDDITTTVVSTSSDNLTTIDVPYEDELGDISIPINNLTFNPLITAVNVTLVNELGSTTLVGLPFIDYNRVVDSSNPAWTTTPIPVVETRRTNNTIARNDVFKISCKIPERNFSYPLSVGKCLMEWQGTSNNSFNNEVVVCRANLKPTSTSSALSNVCVTDSSLIAVTSSTSNTVTCSLSAAPTENLFVDYWFYFYGSGSNVPFGPYKITQQENLTGTSVRFTISGTFSTALPSSLTPAKIMHKVDEFKDKAVYFSDANGNVITRTITGNTDRTIEFMGGWNLPSIAYACGIFTPLWDSSLIDANNGYGTAVVDISQSSTTACALYTNPNKINWKFRVRFWNSFGKTLIWSNTSNLATTGSTGQSYNDADTPSWPANTKPTVNTTGVLHDTLTTAWSRPSTNASGLNGYTLDHLDHGIACEGGVYNQSKFTFTVKDYTPITSNNVVTHGSITVNETDVWGSKWIGGSTSATILGVGDFNINRIGDINYNTKTPYINSAPENTGVASDYICNPFVQIAASDTNSATPQLNLAGASVSICLWPCQAYSAQNANDTSFLHFSLNDFEINRIRKLVHNYNAGNAGKIVLRWMPLWIASPRASLRPSNDRVLSQDAIRILEAFHQSTVRRLLLAVDGGLDSPPIAGIPNPPPVVFDVYGEYVYGVDAQEDFFMSLWYPHISDLCKTNGLPFTLSTLLQPTTPMLNGAVPWFESTYDYLLNLPSAQQPNYLSFDWNDETYEIMSSNYASIYNRLRSKYTTGGSKPVMILEMNTIGLSPSQQMTTLVENMKTKYSNVFKWFNPATTTL